MSKLSPSNNKNNIVLVGHMGSGKSTLGSYLAKKIDYKFIDTDEAIIKLINMSINDFFEKYSEKEFRELEEKTILRLLENNTQHVIAFGGGAFQNTKVRSSVKKNAISVWLKCNLKTLAIRCSKKKNRPLLKNRDIKSVLKELNKLRVDNFSKANYTFNVSKKTKSKLAAEIINELSIYEKN
ncbi:AAA family ATPase [Pelagibacterales bacterium]|nr:AAA family ATPase [Pelagibacterales bacterium]